MGDVGAGGDRWAGGHGGGNVGTPLGSSSRGGGKWSLAVVPQRGVLDLPLLASTGPQYS